MAGPSVGHGVIVDITVKEGKVDEFLQAISVHARASRNRALDAECWRFDVLRSKEARNRFVLYEAYGTVAGFESHLTTPHFAAFRAFGESSGAIERQEILAFESLEGGWSFQANSAPSGKAGTAVVITVDIKADRVADFLKVMELDVKGSRDKALEPNCLRFDVVRAKDVANRFYVYEANVDDEAAANHKTTEHYKAWADFKASGGVEKQTAVRLEAVSAPGFSGFQAATVWLSDATEMPLLGFGTYKVGAVPASATGAAGAPAPPSGPEVCHQVVGDALKAGYRMLDCAQFYMNEHWVGDAWQKSGLRREHLFFISKVWNDVIYQGPEAVKQQVEKSSAELQCGPIDLVLVHWPVPGKHVDAYKALIELKCAGKIKEIGISNYTIEDYQELKAAGVFGENDVHRPRVNQIEVNPLLFRQKTLEFFKSEGVHIQSYRGLMNGPAAWSNAAVQEVATKVGRPASQVLGRFLVQQGISHMPKASKLERMAENLHLFSFELTPAQIATLAGVTQPAALENFKALYTKCIWRDTEKAGSPLPGDRTLE